MKAFICLESDSKFLDSVFNVELEDPPPASPPIIHRFGWKTSSEHWNDDAVRGVDGVNWAELTYPTGHTLCPPGTTNCPSIDLAFEIITEPLNVPVLEACCFQDGSCLDEQSFAESFQPII